MSTIDHHVALRIARLILDRDCAKIGLNLCFTTSGPFDNERFEYHRDAHVRATRELNRLLGTNSIGTYEPRITTIEDAVRTEGEDGFAEQWINR